MPTVQRKRRAKSSATKKKSGGNGRVRKRQLDSSNWVSTGQLAKAAGVTEEAIRYALKEGKISAVVRNNRYRFNMDTELPKYLSTCTRRRVMGMKQLEHDAPEASDEDGITETNAAQRERMYKARRAKLEYLQLQGDLVPAATVEREWQTIAQGVQARLLSIPDRVSTMVEGMKHREIHRVLTEEIRHALTDIADSVREGVKA